MTFATRLTKVRDRSEHFDERTGMCYHQAPPSERVVMHVRDAEQAKPHLEHNPLSLLGACYATPRRKLNDPDTTLIVGADYTVPSKISNEIGEETEVMRKWSIIVTALCVCTAFAVVASAQEKTLCERLGGTPAISAVVDSFAGEVLKD